MSPLLAPLVAIAISAGVAAGTLPHVESLYSKAKADIAEIRRVIDDEHVKAARIAYTVEHLKEGSLTQWLAAGYIKDAPFFSIEELAHREEQKAYGAIKATAELGAGMPL